MSRIVMMTSNHLRHMWLARQLSTVCELAGLVRESKPPVSRKETVLQDSVVVEYFRDRTDRESFYFRSGDNIENSVPCLDLSWGESNSDSVMDFIDAYNPDVIVVFGSSLIKEPLIKRFQGRMINMHLGLSPYYRGSSTNFWPLVDGKPECVGVTLHHVTKKIDGGMIILQARPVMAVNDTSHDIGCKTIMAGAECFNRIFSDFDRNRRIPTGVVQCGEGRLCARDELAVEDIETVNRLIRKGLIRDYLNEKETRDSVYPIVESITY